jgi:hypothetical protein
MQQTTTNATTGASSVNVCYSNGVKEVLSFMADATGTSLTFLATVSKSGSTCFTESGSGSLSGTGSTVITVKNAAGATVATITEDNDTGTETATCGGQTYDITGSDGCGMPMGTTPPEDCTDGTCL